MQTTSLSCVEMIIEWKTQELAIFSIGEKFKYEVTCQAAAFNSGF